MSQTPAKLMEFGLMVYIQQAFQDNMQIRSELEFKPVDPNTKNFQVEFDAIYCIANQGLSYSDIASTIFKDFKEQKIYSKITQLKNQNINLQQNDLVILEVTTTNQRDNPIQYFNKRVTTKYQLSPLVQQQINSRRPIIVLLFFNNQDPNLDLTQITKNEIAENFHHVFIWVHKDSLLNFLMKQQFSDGLEKFNQYENFKPIFDKFIHWKEEQQKLEDLYVDQKICYVIRQFREQLKEYGVSFDELELFISQNNQADDEKILQWIKNHQNK